MQDKSIDNVLRHLHRECMNGRHEGLDHVLALMRLRGAAPDFRKYAKPPGSRRDQRLARLQAQRVEGKAPSPQTRGRINPRV
jgi:hypothetical protein